MVPPRSPKCSFGWFCSKLPVAAKNSSATLTLHKHCILRRTSKYSQVHALLRQCCATRVHFFTAAGHWEAVDSWSCRWWYCRDWIFALSAIPACMNFSSVSSNEQRHKVHCKNGTWHNVQHQFWHVVYVSRSLKTLGSMFSSFLDLLPSTLQHFPPFHLAIAMLWLLLHVGPALAFLVCLWVACLVAGAWLWVAWLCQSWTGLGERRSTSDSVIPLVRLSVRSSFLFSFFLACNWLACGLAGLLPFASLAGGGPTSKTHTAETQQAEKRSKEKEQAMQENNYANKNCDTET